MMADKRFNPLDPLGIFGRVKKDVDRIAESAKLPVPPSPPGLTPKPHHYKFTIDSLSEKKREDVIWEIIAGAKAGLSKPDVKKRLSETFPGLIWDAEMQAHLGEKYKDFFEPGSSNIKSIGNPIPGEFNGKLIDMRDEARRRLIDAGYSETIVDKALNWYDEWLMGMVRMLAPNDTDTQRTLVQKAYSEVAPRAERWIRGIQDALGATA